MKKILATLVSALLFGPLWAQEAAKDPGDLVVTIPAAQVEKCTAEGGCRLFTRAEFESAMEMARQMGEAEGAEKVITDIDKVLRARATKICNGDV